MIVIIPDVLTKDEQQQLLKLCLRDDLRRRQGDRRASAPSW